MNASCGQTTMHRIVVVALGLIGLTSCSLLSSPSTDKITAVLSKMSADTPTREPSRLTLLVYPAETKPPYDTTQMAYSVRPYEVAYFRDHQWGATPSQMLQPLLVRTLETTHHFRAILTPPYTGPYDYSLETEVVALVQDFTPERAVLQLVLRLRLADGATGELLANREISLREPMQQRTPYAGVVAANDATATALREIAQFVLDNAH